jgi:hypothetical protein
MITQDQINKLTEVMERAKDPVEESVRKEGLE